MKFWFGSDFCNEKITIYQIIFLSNFFAFVEYLKNSFWKNIEGVSSWPILPTTARHNSRAKFHVILKQGLGCPVMHGINQWEKLPRKLFHHWISEVPWNEKLSTDFFDNFYESFLNEALYLVAMGCKCSAPRCRQGCANFTATKRAVFKSPDNSVQQWKRAISRKRGQGKKHWHVWRSLPSRWYYTDKN